MKVSGASKRKQKEDKYLEDDGYWLDLIMCGLLLVLGTYSRFSHLDHPNEVVFDEQHFGKFVNWYIRGEYFLDIHPPLGKLILMAAGITMGYNDQIDYDTISAPYPDHTYMILRYMPALFGAALIPLMYITMRLASMSRSVASFVSWLLLVENIVITESRYILCDSFLFFFVVASLALSFKANSEKVLSIPWFIWMGMCGFFVGLTVSVKFTGFGLAGAVVVHQLIFLFVNYDREYKTIFKDIAARGLLIAVPAITVFYFLFVIHIQLLPHIGDGDLFMTSEFRARLLQLNDQVQPEFAGIEPLGMMEALSELISTMHEVNINLRASHPFQSYWYQWIFAQCKAVLYWQKLRAGYGMWVYCVGNAASWLFAAFFGVIGFVVLSLIGATVQFRLAFNPKFLVQNPNSFAACLHEALERHWWHAFLLWVGYLGNYLPYALIPRAVWNYHYIPALIFAFMLCGVIAQILLECLEKYDVIWYNIFKSFLVVVMVSVTSCFLYLAPWTYALPMSDLLHNDRFLFKSWLFTG